MLLRLSRFLLIALALGALVPRARGEEPESLRQKTHLFRAGSRAQLTYQQRSGGPRATQSLQVQYSYGISPDVSIAGMIPFLLDDSSPYPPDARTPRIGGAPLGRPQIVGDFRLWNDGADFLAVELGAALPIQSDPATRNSLSNSWVILGSVASELTFRILGDDLTWRTSFSNYPSLPSKVSTQAGAFFADPAPYLVVATSIQWWVDPKLAPYLGFLESFPTQIDVVTDNPAAAVVVTQVAIPRARWLFAGVDFSLPSWPVVLSVDESYALVEATPALGRWQTTGRLRWAF